MDQGLGLDLMVGGIILLVVVIEVQIAVARRNQRALMSIVSSVIDQTVQNSLDLVVLKSKKEGKKGNA